MVCVGRGQGALPPLGVPPIHPRDICGTKMHQIRAVISMVTVAMVATLQISERR